MLKITHNYGVDLDWVDSFASQHGGRVEGNFIIVPNHLLTGKRYFLSCDFGISAFYVDVELHSDIHLIQEHKTDDFIAIYYNLSEEDALMTLDTNEFLLGRWNYNLSIVDSTLTGNYIVKAGSKIFTLCIFIKKTLIKEYFQNSPSLKNHADDILNPKLNTIVKFTRMSNESCHLLMNLRSQEVGGTSFDFHLRGTVQSLIAEYLQKMTFEQIVIDTLSKDDLNDIIKTQSYLIENLAKPFPGIKLLSKQAGMSPSKYKSLFKKITGLTPNGFFMNNKLLEAQRLITERRLSIEQISTNLSFGSSSYFSAKFKILFGTTPRDFIKQL